MPPPCAPGERREAQYCGPSSAAGGSLALDWHFGVADPGIGSVMRERMQVSSTVDFWRSGCAQARSFLGLEQSRAKNLLTWDRLLLCVVMLMRPSGNAGLAVALAAFRSGEGGARSRSAGAG